MINKRVECKIYGRVQMVMFRDFAQRKAKKLGLAGFIKNMEDGSVFVVAEGDEEKLRKFLELLWKGSVFAKVERVEEKWGESVNEFSKFEIRYEDE